MLLSTLLFVLMNGYVKHLPRWPVLEIVLFRSLFSDVEGLKQQDVAAQLGLDLSAAKSRIQRGRVLLKELLVECCLLETDAQGRLLDIDIRPGCGPLGAYRAGLEKN